MNRRHVLVGLLLLAPVLASSPAVAEDEPAASAIVSGWVEAIRRGEQIYPGGRQRELMARRSAEILPLMLDAFANVDARVGHRLAAVAGLAPEDPGVALLVKGLEDTRGYVPEFTAKALAAIGSERAVPALVTAFRKGKVAQDAFYGALRRIGGTGAEEAVLALLSAYTPATRARAAEALASYPSNRVRRALRKALKDGVAEVRAAALRSMRDAGRLEDVPAVIPFLRHDDPAIRLAAVQALGAIGGEEAKEALLRHFTAARGERLEALEAAVAHGAPLGVAGIAFSARLLESEEAGMRARAARLLARDDTDESRDLLREALASETDPDAALALARVLVTRKDAASLPALRELTVRFPDRTVEALLLLDRAGDPTLPDRLRAIEPDPDAPAGGPLALLAFHGGPDDARRALALARSHPKCAGLAADAHLVAALAGGVDLVEEMVKGLHRLPSRDVIVVVEGPTRPGLRWLHVQVLRILTGRAFGYAPRRPDAENRDAFRKALRWWMAEGRKDATRWSDGAIEAALRFLADRAPARREAALRVLARAGRTDDLARVAKSDEDPAVRVAAARWLVEAGDPRGPARLVETFEGADLIDWAPIPDAPRATRAEAAEALWRAANRCLEYRSVAYGEDVHQDLILEEGRRWRVWWRLEGAKGPDAWFREGCRIRSVALGESADEEARALVGVLRGNHPRFFKLNALARLREIKERRAIPLEIPDLDLLAPGETHPIFEVLATWWEARLSGD